MPSRRVAHLSDLHFGRTDEAIVAALLADVHRFAPHVAVITGDLTQRARTPQFEAARGFLQRLDCPKVVVPGNHDIAPLYRPVRRLTDPFERYKRYVSAELDTTFCDDQIFVAGLNTVAPLRWKEGIVSSRQARWLEEQSFACGPRVRLVASHHPVVNPESGQSVRVAWGARSMLDIMVRARVDIALSGHLHETFSGPSAAAIDRLSSVLIVQASTATSTRLRGHANAYNQLLVDSTSIEVRVREWHADGFATATSKHFPRRRPKGDLGNDPAGLF